MSRTLVRNEDFKSSSVPQQVQGILYYGEGFPAGSVQSPNMGAIYIDGLSGQMWICVTANSTEVTAWKPFASEIKTDIRIDTDVQEGDFIGIYGAGSWAVNSGTLSAAKFSMGAGGSQNAAFCAGGFTSAASVPTNLTELFNGTVWANSSILSAAKRTVGMGSQNAGMVAGGTTSGSITNATELFDGSTWASGGNLSTAKQLEAGMGSQNAGLIAGGATGAASTNSSELFNGTTWYAGATISVAKLRLSGAGSQNAGLIAGGITSDGNIPTKLTELFNGSAWSTSAFLSIEKMRVSLAGSQNSSLIVGGRTPSGVRTNSTEIFNGSVWSASGTLSAAKSEVGSAGSQIGAVSFGGATAGDAPVNVTELHSQSIYRRLNYSNMASAKNIGMAYSVAGFDQVGSLTASVMLGDLPSNIIPQQSFFGISKFNTNQNRVRLSTITATIVSITASDSSIDVNAGQAILNLSTTLTDCFWAGMGILVNRTTVYPVIDGDGGVGTEKAPLVRWENASSSASTSLTVAAVSLQRFTNLTAQSITLNANILNVNLTNVGNITITTFARWVGVGNIISIPRSNTSNSFGSAYNYGSYMITSVSNSGSLFTVSVTSQNSLARTETPSAGIGNITIFQQFETSKICLSADDIKLGFKNKMHNVHMPFWDDFSNGLA